MICLSVLCWLGLLFVVLVAVQDMGLESDRLAYWTVKVASYATAAGVPIILVGFFRSFWKDLSPFGRMQSRRLFAIGLLGVARIALDLIVVSGPTSPVALSGLPLLFIPGDSVGEIDIRNVVGVAFFFCLSAVFRYGNALKEDSDNIL